MPPLSHHSAHKNQRFHVKKTPTIFLDWCRSIKSFLAFVRSALIVGKSEVLTQPSTALSPLTSSLFLARERILFALRVLVLCRHQRIFIMEVFLMHPSKEFAFAFLMGVLGRRDSSKLGLMLSFSIKLQKARNPLRLKVYVNCVVGC